MAKTFSKEEDLRAMVLTIEEAAAICGCTPAWLRKLSRDGYLDRVRPGHVRLGDAVLAIERAIRRVRPPSEEPW